MSEPKRPSELPIPEAARIDSLLQGKIRELVTGETKSGDAAAISRLIRERADLMMPEFLRGRLKAS
jgi:hypothetical protein